MDYFHEDIVSTRSNTGFYVNHATGYSMLGYLCAYYRHYYPIEFCTAFLNCSETEEDIAAGTSLIHQFGYRIMPAKFGVSRAGYFYNKEDGVIYKSVDSIKNMNKIVAEEMYALRDNNYSSFTDLLFDLDKKTSLRSNQLEILIKLDFFSDFGTPYKLMYLVSRFDNLAKRKSIRVDQLESLDVDSDIIARYSTKYSPTRIEEIDVERYIMTNMLDPNDFEKCHKPSGDWSTKKFVKKAEISLEDPGMLPYATKIVIGSYSDINNRDLVKYYEETAQPTPVPANTMIEWQKEYLGYVEYKDPTADKRLIVVMDVDTKYSPRIVAYSVRTGETKDLKIHKRRYPNRPDIITSFSDLPLKDGDMVYLKKCKQEPKTKLGDDGNWHKDWSQMEWWIKDYSIIDK